MKEVPSAHDMTKMVEHLRDLPAPDAYTPRDPIMKNKGFRMVPSNAKSSLDHAMQAAAKVPGPGHYDLSLSLSSGRSASLGGGGLVKSELDVVMNRAKELPGPGAYAHHTTMRSKGLAALLKGGWAFSHRGHSGGSSQQARTRHLLPDYDFRGGSRREAVYACCHPGRAHCGKQPEPVREGRFCGRPLIVLMQREQSKDRSRSAQGY